MTMIVTITMNPTIDVSAATVRVVPVRKLRCTAVRRDPGGGGINVARIVHRFGGECQALYPKGGYTGALLLKLLKGEGVASLAVKTAAEARESFTFQEQATGSQYRFVLPGPQLQPSEWRACLELLTSLPDPPTYIVASGSLPPGVPDDFYARVARVAASSGARVVIDSSGAALEAALDAGVYLAKPNLNELRDLTGQPLSQRQDWEDAAAALVRAGKAEVIALTLGKEGALLATGTDRLYAPGLAVQAVSAVGAGDSFLGAMVWCLSRGDSLEEAFRYGVAAGTAALLTPGTELCRIQDAERLYGQVGLEQR